jgi:hypothetical protein
LFDSAGSLTSDGWVAELTIPFKSLRYPARGDGEVHQWGFQIARIVAGKNEADVWSPMSRTVSGFLTQMGTIQGMTGLSTSRNLELLPTFTAIQLGTLNTTTGAFTQNDVDPEVGVNVKYGVTSDLTADFTYNPDFSQVESDQPQIQVNQRFPLFFPELRPFFLEGQEVFSSRGSTNLVHTRTIIDPRYGGKLTGKAGKATLGLLVANDEAPGKVDDPADPAYLQTAQFLIGRLRYDMAPGSYLGGIVTDREFLDAHSRVAAVDGQFRLSRNDDLEFRAAQSWTRREDGAELSGANYDITLRHNGRSLDYNVSHEATEPGFRTDTGFVQRTNYRRTRGGVGYRWWPQNRVLNNFGPEVNYLRSYNYFGGVDDESLGTFGTVQFARNVRLNAGVSREMERYLGIRFHKWRRNIFGFVNMSRQLTVGGGLNWGDDVRYSETPFLGQSRGARLFLNIVPFSRLRSFLGVNYSKLDDPRTDSRVFSVTILRSQTTYQFTSRLLARSILQYDTLLKTFDANFLLTYRVNSGTVFFAGYDDHYRQGNLLDARLFPTSAFQQTNRAFFTKLSYLFRY